MILTIGPGGCGFTFLNWSISYIRGDVVYQNLNGKIFPVTKNPLQDSTAHKFNKDHLRIIDSRSELLKNYNDKSIIYVVPGNCNDFEHILSWPGKKIIFDNQSDTRDVLARACQTVPNDLYMELIQNLSKIYPRDQVIDVLLDMSKKFIQYYNMPNGYLTLSYKQMFETLDMHILDILEYLELEVNFKRLEHWQNVYQQYKENNRDFIQRLYGDIEKIGNTYKMQILKEILQWRHGQFHIA